MSEAPPDELVILTSDGFDDVAFVELVRLVIEHQDNPQALADAFVALADEDADGYRDDATTAVLAP